MACATVVVAVVAAEPASRLLWLRLPMGRDGAHAAAALIHGAAWARPARAARASQEMVALLFEGRTTRTTRPRRLTLTSARMLHGEAFFCRQLRCR